MPLEAAQRIDCLKDSHNQLRPEVVPSSISKVLASGCSIDHCTADATFSASYASGGRDKGKSIHDPLPYKHKDCGPQDNAISRIGVKYFMLATHFFWHRSQ
jgi:hypothetical protein